MARAINTPLLCLKQGFVTSRDRLQIESSNSQCAVEGKRYFCFSLYKYINAASTIQNKQYLQVYVFNWPQIA